MLNEEESLPLRVIFKLLHIMVGIKKKKKKKTALTLFLPVRTSALFYNVVIVNRDISAPLKVQFPYGLIIFLLPYHFS